MLVLTRKTDERILIGEDIVITVTRIDRSSSGDRVRIGVQAPIDLRIDREEVRDRIVAQGLAVVEPEPQTEVA